MNPHTSLLTIEQNFSLSYYSMMDLCFTLKNINELYARVSSKFPLLASLLIATKLATMTDLLNIKYFSYSSHRSSLYNTSRSLPSDSFVTSSILKFSKFVLSSLSYAIGCKIGIRHPLGCAFGTLTRAIGRSTRPPMEPIV